MNEKALSRAAALCSRSEHCESEIRAKLEQWQVEASDADAIVAKLRHEGFIDEQRFARAWVHDKHLYNGWGPVKLAALLRGKGITGEAIAAALDQFTAVDYQSALERALRDKWRIVCHREPLSARAALLRFAASRGYDAATAHTAADAVIRASDEP